MKAIFTFKANDALRFLIIVLLILPFMNCKDDPIMDDPIPDKGDTTAIDTIGTDTTATDTTNIDSVDLGPPPVFASLGQPTLNVVYFIPNDVHSWPRYRERLTWMLQHAQTYFSREIAERGFGNKTLGLEEDPENPGMVKIQVIHGLEGKETYRYSSKAVEMRNEINRYYDNNNIPRTSNHFMVFQPAGFGVGVPFYGSFAHKMGWAYAKDWSNGFAPETWVPGVGYTDIEQEQDFLGGTIHELGHGLALPHNQEKESDNFYALMGSGNSRYWNQPYEVKLTVGDALILSNCQVFNDNSSIQYYEVIPSMTFYHERIYSTETDLYCSFEVASNVPIKGAIVYQNPITMSDDQGHDAPSWTQMVSPDADGTYEFNFKMPLSDIEKDKKSSPFELTVRYVHENGMHTVRAKTEYNFNYVDDKPDIDYEYTYIPNLDRTGWEIIGFSSEHASGLFPASNLLDGSVQVESQWMSALWEPFPQFVVVDMKRVNTLNGVALSQASDVDQPAGMVSVFEVYTSTDNVNFTSQGLFEAKLRSEGQQFAFSSPVDARYIKFEFKNAAWQTGLVRCAEIGAY